MIRGVTRQLIGWHGLNVLLVIISVGVVLTLMEVGWRIYLYETGRGFFDNPHEFTSPWFTAYNEPQPYFAPDGYYYRNGHVAAVKPSNEIRVICFGGSTTVNFRAGISYPELLEDMIAKEGLGYTVRVLNAGSDGYSSAHTLVNLALRNLDVQPDIITVYENINDLSASWYGDRVLPDYANKYLTSYYLGFRHRTGLLSEIAKVSRLARFLFSQISAIEFPAEKIHADADYSSGLAYFKRNLHDIIAVARANNIKVLLLTQPASSVFRNSPGFLAFNRAIREVSESDGVDFLDIADQVTDDGYFFEDAIHNNRSGVTAVAQVLYPALKRIVYQVAAGKRL